MDTDFASEAELPVPRLDQRVVAQLLRDPAYEVGFEAVVAPAPSREDEGTTDA